MRVTVVTSFSPAGYEQYGCRFLETFDRHAAGEIDLVVYAEAPVPHHPGGSLEVRPLFGIDLAADFIDKFKDDKLASGREPTPAWKAKDRADGYSFKTDAVKFCRKVFAIADAADRIRRSRAGDEMLVWLDADVVTHARVPTKLFADILGNDDVAYLGRDGTHSECGFLAFRLPAALPLILQWQHFYESGTFLRAREWHDSFLFDRAREQVPGLRYHNLTPGGRGHVWFQSPLAQCFDHCKGPDRKAAGFSKERMLRE
jgi:hypothetical protein